jgi:hypothetical protein
MGHNGETLLLNYPPRNGKVQALENEQQRLAPTLQIYNTLSDVKRGDVTYYYGRDMSAPFIPQLFVRPSVVVKEDYVDPMGSYKPHWHRASLGTPTNCLSWIRDSEFHREDLMSKQIWNRNQTDYAVNK